MKIVVMVSGQLGFKSLTFIHSVYGLEFVFTDKNSTEIMSYCKKHNIPYFVGNPRDGRSRSVINSLIPDILVSINYLYLIDDDLISWPVRLAFNIHGSLLPKYRGRTPHVWSIINNEKICGITAHKIDHGCDTGKIISQIKIPIEREDTGADILSKYSECYPNLISDVLSSAESGLITLKEQNESEATYFGKRNPEDGLINWSWQKERIYNWVRAQAYPYPGAFIRIKEAKLIIDQIGFDDMGYSGSMPNGLVLTLDPIRVKTPNGVVTFVRTRNSSDLVTVGDILN